MRKTLLVLLSRSAICHTIIGQTSDGEKLKAKAYTMAEKMKLNALHGEEIFTKNPELGNRETRTAKIIADHLRKLGIETTENVAKPVW